MKIELLEELALGEDRRAAVDKLVLGSVEHTYWTAIYLQFDGKLDEVDALLARWDHREPAAPQLRQRLETRQLLLKAGASIESVFEPLRRLTDDRLEAQRETRSDADAEPSRIDAEIDLDAEIQRLLREEPDRLDAFTDWAHDKLVALHDALTDEQRAQLVDRLHHSAHPALVSLIARDAQHRERGTSNRALLETLTLEQVLALAAAAPLFSNESELVQALASRLCPSAIEHREHPVVRAQWIDRWIALLSRFERGLHAAKARVWLAKLDDDRVHGRYDRALFEALLSLPLQRPYIDAARLSNAPSASIVQHNALYGAAPAMPAAIASDEEIVQDYVEHLLSQGELGSIEPLLSGPWLDRVRAQFELCSSGRGDASRWTARLGAEWVATLRDAVWLQFTPQNPRLYASDDRVELDLLLKNVPELTIKIFELDPRSYFASTRLAPAADINLDGMIARHERALRFEHAPIVAHRAHIALPECDAAGTYVIELIGNGRSARAFVRKGSVRARVVPSAAGQNVSVFDEAGALVTDATIRHGERVFGPREDGTITIPFSTQSAGAGTTVLIERGPIATVMALGTLIERYELALTVDVEPQALLAERQAKLIVTARLYCNDEPVSLALLDEASVSVTAARGDDSNAVTSEPIALRDDQSSVLELRVPEQLASMTVTLRASVERASDGRKETLLQSVWLDANSIHRTMDRSEPHLARTPAGFVLELLGQNGEPLAHHPCTVALAHRAFTDERTWTAQTDAQGRIELGALAGYHHVELRLNDGRSRAWFLDVEARMDDITVDESESITVPYDVSPALAGAGLQLVELALVPARDWTQRCHREEGALRIDPLPAGTYTLHTSPSTRATVHVAPRVALARSSERFASSARTILERRGPSPFVRSARAEQGALRIQIEHSTPACRVHVIATRWCAAPARSSPAAHERARGVQLDPPAFSERLANRTLSDEHRYVIERKRSKRRAGLLIDKPSLLANPWARGATTTQSEVLAHESDSYQTMAPAVRSFGDRTRGAQAASEVTPSAPSYDFLADPATVIANVPLDADGRASVALDALGDAQSAVVIIEDGVHRHELEVALAQRPLSTRERRLSHALDHQQPAIEQRAIQPAPAHSTVALDDVRTATLVVLDTVAQLWRTLSAVAPASAPAPWAWIAEWASFDRAKKRALYSEFACHELHLFLAHKDRPFFEDTVRVHLRNKRHKGFIDRALLGEDLSRYLALDELAQLNAIERALLARLHPPARDAIVRWFADAVEVAQIDPALEQQLLDRVLAASGMSRGSLRDAVDAVSEAPKRLQGVSDRGGGGAGGPPAHLSATLAMDSMAEESARDDSDGVALAEPVPAPPPPAKPSARARDLRERRESKPMFRSPERTQEWAESDWYHLRSTAATPARIAPNRFWLDVAAAAEGPFLSPHFAQCTGSFSEALCAIALLDVPFVAGAHTVERDDVRYRVTLASHALAARTHIAPSPIDEAEARERPLILGQMYLRDDDRVTFDRGRMRDKPVLGPMQRGVAYACRTTVSNPTREERIVDLLQQIPRGSMPLQSAPATRSHRLALGAYATESIEYAFYFPEAGRFTHAGATASCDERVIAYTGGAVLDVRDSLDDADAQSWTWLSQSAPLDALVEHLRTTNLRRVELHRIAWRLRERDAFDRILTALEARLHYDHQLWGYALAHRDLPRLRVWLSHVDSVMQRVGPLLDVGLAQYDPYARKQYEHLEYAPLVNARAHRVGAERTILNVGMAAQYQRFLEVAAHRSRVTEDELLSAAHYWFAQDRADEAIALLQRVRAPEDEPRIVLDYLRAYGHCVSGELERAQQLAHRWKDYPVDRWRTRWTELSLMIREALGAPPSSAAANPEAQAQSMVAHASTEPSLEVTMRAGSIGLQHRNLARCELRLYRFDIELLFSQQPFVQGDTSRFTWISPAHSQWIELDPAGATAVALPEALARDNLVIALRAEGLQRTITHYDHDLATELSANYGQLRVLRASTQRPSVATYVKVFARHRGGEVRFYKDGYTDARGRFDYASLSTTDLDTVERFALLIASEDAGSMVLEAAPPPR